MNPSSTLNNTYWDNGGDSSADGGTINFNLPERAYNIGSYAYTTAGTYTIGDYTYSIYGYNWVSRAQVPDDADILEITLTVTGQVNTGIPNYTPYVRLHPNASWKSGSAITGSTQATRTWSGDLDYWNLTHAEALEAIKAGSSTNAPRCRFRVIDYSASGQFYCNSFRMGVVYASRTGHMLLGR